MIEFANFAAPSYTLRIYFIFDDYQNEIDGITDKDTIVDGVALNDRLLFFFTLRYLNVYYHNNFTKLVAEIKLKSNLSEDGYGF